MQRVFQDICEVGSAHEVQRWLQTDGKDIINAAGPRHRTPLHVAAQKGHLEVLKLLVEHGADLKATTFWGSTAEELAEKFKNGATAAFLKAEREKVGDAGAGAGASRQGERAEQDQPRDEQQDQEP